MEAAFILRTGTICSTQDSEQIEERLNLFYQKRNYAAKRYLRLDVLDIPIGWTITGLRDGESKSQSAVYTVLH